MSARWFDRARQLTRRAREECTALAGWWLHEVREAFADIQQRWAPGKPHRTTLSLARTTGTVLQEWRNGTTKSMEFQRTPAGDWPHDRAAFWPDAAADGTAVHVVLPRAAILMRRMWLPAGAGKNLAPVVELQLERELPIARDQVQADWRIEAVNRSRTRIEVAIAILRRSELEALLDTLNRWRLRVATVGVDLGTDRPAFNFSARRTPHRSGRLTGTDKWLMIGAAALAFAYACVLGTQWLHERMVVEDELSKTSVAAARVERLLSDLDRRREPIASLQRLLAAPSSTEILATLTAEIAHDSWLPQLEIRCPDDGCTLKFTAITSGATSLVDRLEQSPHFDNVALQSSSATGLATGRERADVSARWVAERKGKP